MLFATKIGFFMNIIQKFNSFASTAYDQIPLLSNTLKKCIVRMVWHTSKAKKDVYSLASENRILFAKEKLLEAQRREKLMDDQPIVTRKWKGGSIFWQAELKRRQKDYHWAIAYIKKMEKPLFE